MSKDTQIRRGYHLPQDHFTIVPNAWIRDARLSRRARGLLVELMSHDAGWKTSIASLMKAGTEGESSIKATLRELKDAGYLELEWTRDGKGRRTGSTYTITEPAARETPSSDPLGGNHLMDHPTGAVHEGGFPPVDQPPVANPGTKKNIFKEEQTTQEEKPACRVLDVTHEAAPEERGGGSTTEFEEQTTSRLDELQAAARAAGLSARFDRITDAQRATIDALVVSHGVPALVAHARRQHRADSPAKFVAAWIPAWLALPEPQLATRATRPECTACDNGWLDAENPCPTCRPNLCRTAAN